MHQRRPDSDLSILFDLFSAGQRGKRLLAVAMEGSPLRPEEYAVYSVAFDHGPVTPTEMAHFLGMPVTTVLDHVRSMLDRRHLKRTRNPEDGRSYLVALTAAGRKTHQQAAQAFDRAMIPLAARLGTTADQVRSALDLIGSAMDSTLLDLLGSAGEAEAK